MPGFHGRTVLPGHSPYHATDGEVVIGISVKNILVLRQTGGLHRKLRLGTILPLKPFGQDFFSWPDVLRWKFSAI